MKHIYAVLQAVSEHVVNMYSAYGILFLMLYYWGYVQFLNLDIISPLPRFICNKLLCILLTKTRNKLRWKWYTYRFKGHAIFYSYMQYKQWKWERSLFDVKCLLFFFSTNIAINTIIACCRRLHISFINGLKLLNSRQYLI